MGAAITALVLTGSAMSACTLCSLMRCSTMPGTSWVFDLSSSISSSICLPSMALVSSVASLIALAAETPYAEVAPVRDRNAPILMVLGFGCSVEHADSRTSKDRKTAHAFVIAGIKTKSDVLTKYAEGVG